MSEREIIVQKIMSWLGAKKGDAVHKYIVDSYNYHTPLPQGYKVKYTDAWCATTVSAAFIDTDLADLCPIECSCNRMVTKAKNMGIWVEDDAYVPQIGDIILYDWDDNGVGDNVGTPDHVGIITSILGNTLTVCEGNKSNAVGVRELSINGRYIRGYVVPKYSEEIKPIAQKQYGIDVSQNQGDIDWELVKDSGISFACLRSTKKSMKADEIFERSLSECKRLSIDYSCYKYCYATSMAQAYKEADSVIELLDGRPMMIWYDVEDAILATLPKKQLESIIFAFIQRCNLKGYNVGIYVSDSWYKNYITDFLKNNFKFWIARYGKNTGLLDTNYKPSADCFAWQYTSKGHVPGIVGNVDLDVIM